MDGSYTQGDEFGGSSPVMRKAAARRRAPWQQRLFQRLLSAFTCGRLTVVLPDGTVVAPESAMPGPEAVWVLHRWRFLRRVVLAGDIGFAEGYIAGDWSSPNLPALIEFFARNDDGLTEAIKGSLPGRLVNRLCHAIRANTKRRSRRNIIAHYDLGNAFFAHWLDADMTYSSALYQQPDQDLEAAQDAKYDAILDALDLRGGEKVLEIGCGWGALAARIAQRGCSVTALTLSPAQRDYALARLATAGLSDKVDVRLVDYRDATGSFDRIVSIEMIEAVGQRYWPVYFGKLRALLAPKGHAVLQAITIADSRFGTYAREPDFIQRYVFPGGMLPSPTLLRAEIAAAGLRLAGAQTFGLGYAQTLAEWRRRFQAAWPSIQSANFDTTFKRMWDYYLAYCEGGFRSGATDVGLYRLVPAHG